MADLAKSAGEFDVGQDEESAGLINTAWTDKPHTAAIIPRAAPILSRM